jgi:hypothetical protein
MASTKTAKGRPRGRTFRKAQGQNGFATSSNSVDVAPRQITAMILGDSGSEDEDTKSEEGGVPLSTVAENSTGNGDFQINKEYAARFLHNKKREELQRCRN